MSLTISPIYKCLNKKSLVFGFELLDLFSLCLILAVLSFIFSAFPYKFFLTWVPVSIFGVILRITKEGKPENYLKHLLKYHLSPKQISAFEKSNINKIVIKANMKRGNA